MEGERASERAAVLSLAGGKQDDVLRAAAGRQVIADLLGRNPSFSAEVFENRQSRGEMRGSIRTSWMSRIAAAAAAAAVDDDDDELRNRIA